MSQELTIITAYMVVAIFLLAALALLAMIIHLSYTALHKKKQFAQHKQVLLMIAFTLGAITAFFLSTALIILLVFQTILLDAHSLDPTYSLHSFYDDTFDSLHYTVTMLDQLGHLAMLTVFILRLQMCFANSIFGYSKNLIRFLYAMLVLLVAVSLAIILEMCVGSSTQTIIISQVIWEILVEVMCVWLLYLFVSKLQQLVKMALGSSRKNLRATITYNLEEKSKTSPTNLRIVASKTTAPSQEKVRSPSPSPSPIPSGNPQRTNVPSASRVSVDMPRQNTAERKVNQTVLNNQNLINVMTKMTLLVVIAVLGSLLSVITNMYWQIYSISHLESGSVSVSSMWGYVAPIADMCLASAMLYLQFDFTKGVYARLCNKMDILLLQICGDLLDQNVQSEQNIKENSKRAVASQTNTVLSIDQSKQRGRRSTASLNTVNSNKLAIDVKGGPSAEYDGVFKPPSPTPRTLAESSNQRTEFGNAFRDRPKLGSNVSGHSGRLRLEFTRSISAKSNVSVTPPITPRSQRSDRSSRGVSPRSPMRNDQVMGVRGHSGQCEVERAVQRAQPEGQSKSRKGGRYQRPGVNGSGRGKGKGKMVKPPRTETRSREEDTENLKGEEGDGNVSRLRAMWE